MELINTKDLYENDAFVIIEAEFEDSETKKRIVIVTAAVYRGFNSDLRLR